MMRMMMIMVLKTMMIMTIIISMMIGKPNEDAEVNLIVHWC